MILCKEATAAALTIATLAAVAPATAADNNIVGRWFTEGVESNTHLQVFIETKADGTYEKDIRVIDQCETKARAKETGKWTFEHGDLATESQAVDGKPVTGSFADIHDLFNVTRVDDTHINIYDTETNITWALLLVSASYQFPPPSGCSV